MSASDSLVAFLRARYGMAAQGAAALPHAIGNIQSLWSPDRLLADVDAKLKIVEECVRTLDFEDHGHALANDVLRLLALPFADHKDYRETWKP
jgi:hypothetical protein